MITTLLTALLLTVSNLTSPAATSAPTDVASNSAGYVAAFVEPLCI